MTGDYPAAPSADVVEIIHGVEVADPYRPLEDPDGPGVADWVERQNALSRQFLDAVPSRPAIRDRIAELWNYPKAGAPFERGGRWFQFRNTGLQSQSVLYVMSTPTDEGRVLIDPNQLSADGTVALTGLGLSGDGSRLAWATSDGGSDWMTWHVRETTTGVDLPDVIEWSKFSGASWAGDRFYYTAFARPRPGAELTESATAPRVAVHRLGTDQTADEVVFDAAGSEGWIPAASVTDDRRFLVVTITVGTGSETHVLVADLAGGGELRPLNGEFEAKDVVVDHDGSGALLVLTDRGAALGRVVRARPGERPDQWEEVVPETDDVLQSASLCGRHLVCRYLHHAQSVLRVHPLDGGDPWEIPLATAVTVVEVSGRPGSDLVHFVTTGFTQSGAVWSHDLGSGATEVVKPSGAAFDANRYVTEQVFVTSADGTQIPLFVTRSATAEPRGDAPVLLYGYGGFDVAVTPTFSVTWASWLDRGAMLAVASLRGGGEYGRFWHDSGRLAHKQNVFDDFAACARWLSSSGWSTPARTAIMGGSNGGLLVGASITQHPELFGAALAEVGVMDMLRFHRWTIGWAWTADYGSPDDPEAFEWLRAYSPLHNIREGACYPPMMIMTGDHDDRVVPAHSYKFAAAMQQAQACDAPILLNVATSGGHGMGKPTEKLIEEAADRLAFLTAAFGL
jgi:prolyl oligopeptidase